MKTKVLSAILLLATCYNNSLLAQNWLWAKSFTGTSSNSGNYVFSQGNGNIYCFGEYEPAGNVTAGQTTIGSIGRFNAFVAQFDQNGNFITITNVPSTTVDHVGYGGEGFASRITTDNSDNMCIGVNITDNGVIDTIAVTGTAEVTQMALSKWNAASRCLWVKYLPGSLIIPAAWGNNIYVAGLYQQSNVHIGQIQLSDSANKQQGYIARLDSQGTCIWAKQVVGGNTVLNSIDVKNNHIYVAATSDSCFIYDTLHVCALPNQGLGILMQLDTSGSIIWTKKISAANRFSATGAIAVIKSGGFYMEGFFDTTLYIGHDTLNKQGNELIDDYIAKFDDFGNLIWIRQIPFTGTPGNLGNMVTDSLGNVYFAGGFNGTQTFGNYTITSQSYAQLFVTRYDPNGNCMGVVTVPNAQALDLTEDNAGNAIVTGFITGTAIFGNTTLEGTPNEEFFVAKLSAITDSTTGEQTLLPNDSALRIYANPSRGLFTVDVPQDIINAANGNLTVYDNGGNLIKTQPVDISGSNIQVNLGEVMRGVYTVLLTANGKEFKGRVAIQ